MAFGRPYPGGLIARSRNLGEVGASGGARGARPSASVYPAERPFGRSAVGAPMCVTGRLVGDVGSVGSRVSVAPYVCGWCAGSAFSIGYRLSTHCPPAHRTREVWAVLWARCGNPVFVGSLWAASTLILNVAFRRQMRVVGAALGAGVGRWAAVGSCPPISATIT